MGRDAFLGNHGDDGFISVPMVDDSVALQGERSCGPEVMLANLPGGGADGTFALFI